ncbi:MAG: hypothetical protein HYU83_05135 [Chloroflexi bacterium]|nr:hypothetical protein [Chloroflexota bacterium]
MPLAKQISMEWQRREILCAWIAWQTEVGSSEKGIETMRRVVDRKADLHLDQMIKDWPISANSDPITVCRVVADYLTASGYAEYQIGKISDKIMYRDWKNCVEMPMIPWALREMGLKVTPNPSTSLFHAALRRFCKIDAKIVRGADVPTEALAQIPKGWTKPGEWHEDEWGREYWILSPLKK